jgi:hypothetical protein
VGSADEGLTGLREAVWAGCGAERA